MLEIMIQMVRLQLKRKCLLLQCLFVYFTFSVKFAYVRTYLFLVYTHWNHPPHFNTGFMRKSVSTNVAGLGTTYDITPVYSD